MCVEYVTTLCSTKTVDHFFEAQWALWDFILINHVKNVGKHVVELIRNRLILLNKNFIFVL